jgi:ABC-type transporter Mla maintaining outer membrane lipid asymmetry ATPase subunit MlaF
VPVPDASGGIGDEGPDGDYCLAVEGLRKRFDDGPELYSDLNLRIRHGEIVVIIGESGIGKSVFLKHLIGLEDPSAGSIWYRGTGRRARDWPIHALPESEMASIRREIAMVFQATSLFDWMTVHENISLPLMEHRHDVLGQVDGFAGDPHDLLVRMRRLPRPPPPFDALAAAMQPSLAELASKYRELASAALDPARAAALAPALVPALVADRVRAMRGGGLGAEPGSPWASAGPPLRDLGGALLGELIDGIDATELPEPFGRYRGGYRRARAGLRFAYRGLRESWSPPFDELKGWIDAWWRERGSAPGPTAPTAPPSGAAGSAGPDGGVDAARCLAEWLVRVAANAATSVAGRTAAELVREVLCTLKGRPDLLTGAEPAAGREPGARVAAFASELAAFGKAVRELQSELLAGIAGAPTASDGQAWSVLALAWLAAHAARLEPSDAARGPVARIIERFSQHPEDLGALLARAPSPPADDGGEGVRPVSAFIEAYAAFRREFAGRYGTVLDAGREALADAFIELVVQGLMHTLKLDIEQDRDKLPSQLSGGMKTRVGLARSLATLPTVVLYDEPTAGLDPVLSKSIAREILDLAESGEVSTSIVVTHDKDLYGTLKLAGRVRMLYLSEGRLLDRSAVPVRDALRAEDGPAPSVPVETEGGRGYPPRVFISEFEPSAR